MAVVWIGDKRTTIKSTAGVLKLASDNMIYLYGMKMTVCECEIKKVPEWFNPQCSCVTRFFLFFTTTTKKCTCAHMLSTYNKEKT